MMDMLAVTVQLPIHLVLLSLGDVAIMLGFIRTQLICDFTIRLLVAHFLVGVNLAILYTIINTILLVLQALVDFIHARMSWNIGIGGLCESSRGGEAATGDECRSERYNNTIVHINPFFRICLLSVYQTIDLMMLLYMGYHYQKMSKTLQFFNSHRYHDSYSYVA